MKQTIGQFILQPNKDFPIDCELLDYMQTNVAMVSILGNIAGDKAILQGCELEQNNTRRKVGYVFLKTKDYPDGEVLCWEGGNVSGGMYIKQEVISVSAQGYEYPQAYVVRSLAAGIGSENYNWNDFKAIKTNQELDNYSQSQDDEITKLSPPPLGLVYPWAGAITGGSTPAGYMMCDGTRLVISEYPELHKVIGRLHTPSNVPSGYFCLPDLRSRFIVGYSSDDGDYNAIAKTGGEKKHALTNSEMPSHSHQQYLWASASGDWKGGGRNSYPNATSQHDKTTPYGSTGSAGSGISHENRPPYYTLAYVMRVK